MPDTPSQPQQLSPPRIATMPHAFQPVPPCLPSKSLTTSIRPSLTRRHRPTGPSRPFVTRITATASPSRLPWRRHLDAQILQKSPRARPERATSTGRVKSEGLSWRRVRRLLNVAARLTVPFLQTDRMAKVHLLACVAFVLVGSWARIAFTTASGDLMSALADRDVATFGGAVAYLFGVCVIAVPLSPLGGFARKTFILRWRQFLTKRGLSLYFLRRNFYKLSNLREEANDVDNPDEIIQDQFYIFASSVVNIFLNNLRTVVDVVTFSILLTRISQPLYFVVISMVLFGTVLINTIGRRIVDLEAEVLRRTADFRFALARIRIHAESIAFYNGDVSENKHVVGKLDAHAETVLEVHKTELPVELFVDSFYFLPSVIPILVLSPAFFSGTIPLGDLTKASSAFNILFTDLSIFIRNYNSYASLGASLERLSRFVSTVEKARSASEREFDLPADSRSSPTAPAQRSDLPHILHPRITLQEQKSQDGLMLSNVSISTPEGRECLVSNINLHLQAGEKLLIVGRSGKGKTSLLRAIAGLWTCGSGTISRPLLDDTFFLPQRAYERQGTLRDQLCYPRNNGAADDVLHHALKAVGLADLAGRAGGLDATQDWSEYLSAGEGQRVAFARLLIAEPKLALIDEGTSAVDLRTERRLMQVAGRLGCGVVSVGHRPSLVEFHDWVLHLGEDGARVVPAGRFAFPGVV